MDREKKILEQVEKTLQALDDLPRLQANPFLYTRVQAAMTAETKSWPSRLSGRLHLKAIVFSLLIIFNLVTTIYFYQGYRRNESKQQLISALSSEYETAQNIF